MIRAIVLTGVLLFVAHVFLPAYRPSERVLPLSIVALDGCGIVIMPVIVTAILALGAAFAPRTELEEVAEQSLRDLVVMLAILMAVGAILVLVLAGSRVLRGGFVVRAVPIGLLLALVLALAFRASRAKHLPAGMRTALAAGVFALVACPICELFFVRERFPELGMAGLRWPFWAGVTGWILILIGMHLLSRPQRGGAGAPPQAMLAMVDGSNEARRMQRANHVCATCETVIACGGACEKECSDCGRTWCRTCGQAFCCDHGDPGRPCRQCGGVLS
jgi:hypothetical protein